MSSSCGSTAPLLKYWLLPNLVCSSLNTVATGTSWSAGFITFQTATNHGLAIGIGYRSRRVALGLQRHLYGYRNPEFDHVYGRQSGQSGRLGLRGNGIENLDTGNRHLLERRRHYFCHGSKPRFCYRERSYRVGGVSVGLQRHIHRHFDSYLDKIYRGICSESRCMDVRWNGYNGTGPHHIEDVSTLYAPKVPEGGPISFAMQHNTESDGRFQQYVLRFHFKQ